MKFTKLKKKFIAGIAALMCAVTAISIPAAAKTSETDRETAKAFGNVQYSDDYIRLTDKYSETEPTKTITFDKSYSKKLFERMKAATDSKNPEFSVNLVVDDQMLSVTVSKKRIKCIACDEDAALAAYTDTKKAILLSLGAKLKATVPFTDDDIYGELDYDAAFSNVVETFSELSHILDDTDVTDKTAVKRFKIKSKDVIYYYEEFDVDDQDNLGILFDENGNPLTMISGRTTIGFNFSDTVDADAFVLPKGYKRVTEETLDEFFDSLDY